MANLEGKKAPEFSLDGSDGKKHSLADYKGKSVVMFFYPKDSPLAEPRKLAGSASATIS